MPILYFDSVPASSQIPTFDASGGRTRSCSLERIEYLLSLSKVVVRRNRRGTIVWAQFRPSDGANPLRNSAHMGQKYSVLENVGDSGSRAWKHRSLLQKQDIEELTGVPMDSPKELDLYLRSIFRNVQLSLIKRDDSPSAPAPVPAANVVCIDSGRRRKRRRNRPVEFDSQGRAA